MIGVIGCGNMASAIVKGFHQFDPDQKFITYTPTETRAIELANAVKGTHTKNLIELQAAKHLIIGCKPQQFDQLIDDLKKINYSINQQHIISIMAAINLESLTKKLQTNNISRVMPNTPSLIGVGHSLILHHQSVNKANQHFTKLFFNACGTVSELTNETLFNQATTISGSGPAYFFLFAKTLTDKLIHFGMEPKEAQSIVAQTMLGSARLIQDQSELSLSELIDQVTSKGGVTIEAIKCYQDKQLEQITNQALESAYQRSLALTEQFQ